MSMFIVLLSETATIRVHPDHLMKVGTALGRH